MGFSKPKTALTIAFPAKAWALACLLLFSCGTQGGLNSKFKFANAEATGPFYITLFTPAASAVASMPTQVIVTFNKFGLNAVSAQALTHYTFVCNSATYNATAVAYADGSPTSIVTLPAVAGLAAGTSCSLTVSTYVRDLDGNALSGNRVVTYVQQ